MLEVDIRDRIALGQYELQQLAPKVERREKYDRGEHDLPFAPEGVNEEYVDLQEQAIANWITLAVNAPVQRIRGEQFKSGMGDELDKTLWRDVWQANKLDDRQSVIYRAIMRHGRGIASVWPNLKNRDRPIVRPEANDLVYLHPSEDDPFEHDWTVKLFTVQDYPSSEASRLILPGTVSTTRSIAIVYSDTEWVRMEKGGRTGAADWVQTAGGTHPLGENPFVAFDYRPDTKARIWSPMDPLIPQQDAINTIRFNTLLAMQFSAFRQRIVVGYDPVMRDGEGNPLWERDGDGNVRVDATGQPIPQLSKPGRAGVDRILAFPGGDTKVFDLAESNLKNYIEVLSEFLTQFFATGQIPPQYLLSRMANLSGDALSGAESTLASLVKELQLVVAEGGEGIMRRGARASGREWDFPDAELLFADAEARSFSQVVDGITKLIVAGFPKRSAFEMLPNSTPQKVERWMNEIEDEQFQTRLALAARPFTDATQALTASTPPPVDQTEVTSGGATSGGS